MLKIITIIIFSTLLSSCVGLLPSVASVVHTTSNTQNDRRTIGEIVDDNSLYWQLFTTTEQDEKLSDTHLNFLTYNNKVLITGEVPNQEIKTYIEKSLKQKIPKISSIFNEIKIAPTSSLFARVKDKAINLRIGILFYSQEVFHPVHIKSIVEAQTAYLMGEVTKREADKAAIITSQTPGVVKVVKLFTYLKSRPKAEIERDRLREENAIKKAELEKKQAEIEIKKAKLLKEIRGLENNKTGTSF